MCFINTCLHCVWYESTERTTYVNCSMWNGIVCWRNSWNDDNWNCWFTPTVLLFITITVMHWIMRKKTVVITYSPLNDRLLAAKHSPPLTVNDNNYFCLLYFTVRGVPIALFEFKCQTFQTCDAIEMNHTHDALLSWLRVLTAVNNIAHIWNTQIWELGPTYFIPIGYVSMHVYYNAHYENISTNLPISLHSYYESLWEQLFIILWLTKAVQISNVCLSQ